MILMAPLLSDAQLISKFAAWDGRAGYFDEAELKRIIDLAAKANPGLLEAEVRRRLQGLEVEIEVTTLTA